VTAGIQITVYDSGGTQKGQLSNSLTDNDQDSNTYYCTEPGGFAIDCHRISDTEVFLTEFHPYHRDTIQADSYFDTTNPVHSTITIDDTKFLLEIRLITSRNSDTTTAFATGTIELVNPLYLE
jgi:hypothetical protein